jgi:hypothetical protein
MGLTIGITGHTSGFGKHIAKACTQLGHNVIGFSMTNGYHFPEDIDAIFKNKYDVLINNTEFSTTQVNIALLAHSKGIRCINIGSKITEAKVTAPYYSMKNNKLSLKMFSETNKQKYLTWGFTKGHWILENNPHLLETITTEDAVKEVLNELESLFNSK